MTGLAGPGRFDAADGLSGGAADHAGVVGQFDRQRGVADVHGHDGAGVDADEGDLLPDDHDDPAVAGHPLHGDRLGRGPRWRPGRAGVAQVPHPVPADRVGPGTEQLAGVGVEEHQGVFLDPDGHPCGR